MLSEVQIRRLIEEIVQGYNPEKVYLFGSYASNTASENSDIDLFIVKSTQSRKIDRSIEVRQAIKHYPVAGLDIIVYTPEELQMAQDSVVNIGKEAVAHGKLMYERV
jgi:predicted nucleotidyltransferase